LAVVKELSRLAHPPQIAQAIPVTTEFSIMHDRSARNIALAVFFETGLGFVGAAIAWVAGISLRAQLEVTPDSIFRGLFASLPLILLLLVFYNSRWTSMVRLKKQVEQLVAELFGGSNWFGLALVGLAAGVGEEVLFRGAIQPLLIQWTTPQIAIAVTALLFGAVHAVSLLYFILATLVGVYFGWLAFAYQDLVAPIIAHGFYDFVALAYIRHRSNR